MPVQSLSSIAAGLTDSVANFGVSVYKMPKGVVTPVPPGFAAERVTVPGFTETLDALRAVNKKHLARMPEDLRAQFPRRLGEFDQAAQLLDDAPTADYSQRLRPLHRFASEVGDATRGIVAGGTTTNAVRDAVDGQVAVELPTVRKFVEDELHRIVTKSLGDVTREDFRTLARMDELPEGVRPTMSKPTYSFSRMAERGWLPKNDGDAHAAFRELQVTVGQSEDVRRNADLIRTRLGSTRVKMEGMPAGKWSTPYVRERGVQELAYNLSQVAREASRWFDSAPAIRNLDDGNRQAIVDATKRIADLATDMRTGTSRTYKAATTKAIKDLDAALGAVPEPRLRAPSADRAQTPPVQRMQTPWSGASRQDQSDANTAKKLGQALGDAKTSLGLSADGTWSTAYLWDPKVFGVREKVDHLQGWLSNIHTHIPTLNEQIPSRLRNQIPEELAKVRKVLNVIHQDKTGLYKPDLERFVAFADEVSRSIESNAGAVPPRTNVDNVVSQLRRTIDEAHAEVGGTKDGHWSTGYLWDTSILSSRTKFGQVWATLENVANRSDLMNKLPTRLREQLPGQIARVKEVLDEIHTDRGGVFKPDLEAFLRYADRVSKSLERPT